MLPGARLVGQADQRVGALCHLRYQIVVTDRRREQRPHVIAVARQRVGRRPHRVGMRGIAHHAGKSLQVEPRLLRESEELLVKARSLALRRFQEVVAGGPGGEQVAVDGAREHRAGPGSIGLVQKHERGQRDGGRDRDRNASDQKDPVTDTHAPDRSPDARLATAHSTRLRGAAVGFRRRNVVGIGFLGNEAESAPHRRAGAVPCPGFGPSLQSSQDGGQFAATCGAGMRTSTVVSSPD